MEAGTKRLYGDLVLVAFLLSGGWWASQTLATNQRVDKSDEKIAVAEAKTNYILDLQIQSLLAQVERIQSKKNKTIDDREQTRYLRDEIKRIRAVKEGEKQ